MILELLGKLGGRKFLVMVLNSVLLPILATKLPSEIAVQVVSAIAAVAGSFIFAQGYADGKSKGATSSVPKVK